MTVCSSVLQRTEDSKCKMTGASPSCRISRALAAGGARTCASARRTRTRHDVRTAGAGAASAARTCVVHLRKI
jgi:hypothetical protein